MRETHFKEDLENLSRELCLFIGVDYATIGINEGSVPTTFCGLGLGCDTLRKLGRFASPFSPVLRGIVLSLWCRNQHANIALKAGRSAWGMVDRGSWASEGKHLEAWKLKDHISWGHLGNLNWTRGRASTGISSDRGFA